MAGREVPRVRTPLAMGLASRLLVSAFGPAALSREQAALLLGQVALETASGSALDNDNPGNLTGTGPTGEFFRPAWFTVDASSSPKLQQLHAAMLRGQAPSAFRSYPEPLLGFIDYANQIRNRFPSILAAAGANDPDAMARAIVTSGYTPDAQPGTGNSLRRLRDQFLAQGLFADLPPSSSAPSSSSSTGLLLIAAAVLLLGGN